MTCVSGFKKNGWKCLSNLNVGFNINLNAGSLQAVLTNIDLIVQQLLTLLGISLTKVDAITFSSIKFGSVGLVGFATPPTISEGSVVSSTGALSSGLSSNSSLGGFPVTSSSVVSNGVSATSETNLPLIVGLSVGIPLLVCKLLLI